MIEIINVIDDCTRVLVASTAVATCTTANSWDTLCQGAQQWGWPERVPWRYQGDDAKTRGCQMAGTYLQSI